MLKKAQLAQGILVQWVETYQNQVEQFCLQIQLRHDKWFPLINPAIKYTTMMHKQSLNV